MLRKLSWNHAILSLVITLATSRMADAGDCCQHCGREAECRSVCRCINVEKKVEIACWGCKEEDFCVPGPSEMGCKHCEDVCDPKTCDCEKKGCCGHRRFIWWEASPCTARTFTRKKLQKKIVVRKIPSYKWVTEQLCEECAADCSRPTAKIIAKPVLQEAAATKPD